MRSCRTSRSASKPQAVHGCRQSTNGGVLAPAVFFASRVESRQLDLEPRTFADALAVRPHPSAVQLDEMPRQRQTEAESAVAACVRRVRLPESLEDVGQRL